MNRCWSLLFLSVPLLGTAIVWGASRQTGLFADAWLPESIGPRTESVDDVFNRINIVLGFVLMLTGLILAWSLWRFPAGQNRPASFRRNHLVLELIWTLIPAGILTWLAFYQLPFWNENKVDPPVRFLSGITGDKIYVEPIARVIARQFDWTFVYPGMDGEFDTRDDLVSPGVLILPQDEELVLELTSEDVIHSFCINALRLKQDIVPQLNPQIWFQVTRSGEWEINCTELCGWGHFRMAAMLRVVPRAEFDAWRQSAMQDRER